MEDVNLWAVLVAALASFFLGGLWYSPALFGKVWMKEAGQEDAQPGHPAKVFGMAFLFSVVAAYALAALLHEQFPDGHGVEEAVGVGILVSVGFVATCFGINYQFAQNSVKLWAIDAGYHIGQFALFGLILGLWQ